MNAQQYAVTIVLLCSVQLLTVAQYHRGDGHREKPRDSLHDGRVHPCQRECRTGEPPKTCEYHFKVEWYYTMSKACYDCPYNLTDCYRPDCVPADGVEKPIIVINRSLPGPSIQVGRAACGRTSGRASSGWVRLGWVRFGYGCVQGRN